MDSTYKLNINEFPVLVLGISDAQQQFHMLSISVLSHHTESIYEEVLRVFQRIVMHVVPGINFSPQYVVTDCDVAERYVFTTCYILCFITWFQWCYNYVHNVSFPFPSPHRDAILASFPRITHLMCYFHVMKNCKEKLNLLL